MWYAAPFISQGRDEENVQLVFIPARLSIFFRAAFFVAMSSLAFVSLNPVSVKRPLYRAPSHATRRRQRASRSTIKCAQVIKPPTRNVSKPVAKKPSAKPHLTAEGDSLESTLAQKALFLSFLGGSSAVALKVASEVASAQEGLANLAMVALSYIFTDFAVGVYHHAVDNYGSAETPIFGYQIAAFQGHHQFPWTITSRDIANNLYRLTYPTLPQLLALLALPLPSTAVSFYGSFLFFIVLSQETHRQAHMTRAAPWVRFLQDAGLILSQRAHAAHHKAPPSGSFEGNYCILSGVWNEFLDRTQFFRMLEAAIFVATGTKPICWGLDEKLEKESLGFLPRFARKV